VLRNFVILQIFTLINLKTAADNQSYWVCFGSLFELSSSKMGLKITLSLPVKKLFAFKSNGVAKSGNTGILHGFQDRHGLNTAYISWSLPFIYRSDGAVAERSIGYLTYRLPSLLLVSCIRLGETREEQQSREIQTPYLD